MFHSNRAEIRWPYENMSFGERLRQEVRKLEIKDSASCAYCNSNLPFPLLVHILVLLVVVSVNNKGCCGRRYVSGHLVDTGEGFRIFPVKKQELWLRR